MDSKEEEDIQNAKFSHERLMKNLEGIHKSLPDIEPQPYLDTMIEFVKIFNIIGSAMAIAFKGKYFWHSDYQISLLRSQSSEETMLTPQVLRAES